ncbi:hypothetical protein ACOTFF_05940 [Achromobacter xylosoxidans]
MATTVFVVVYGILQLIKLVVPEGKPFDTNQLFALFQTVIALLAMGCVLWASLSQSNVTAQRASDSADESFYRTIGSMAVIGRQIANMVEDAPRHVLRGWQARLSKDLLAQMRSGTLLSFPDERSLDAALAVIRIGEELVCHCTDCPVHVIGGCEENFRQRSLMLNTLKTALSELAALGAAWNINASTRIRARPG